jgi:hypothetical protein
MPGDAESKPSDKEIAEQFFTVAAGVADGGLVMPAPFDVASSAALAVNDDRGDRADKLFDVTAARESKYEVRITEVQGEDSRDLINTTCIGQGPLFALLDDVMDDLEARRSN